MTRVWLLMVGALATLGFATIVLIALPRIALVDVPVPEQLRPATVEEIRAAEVAARGRQIYLREGCVYCHSQQVRDPSFTTDVDRGWGTRATVPADYVLDRPHVLGTMRTGPDLINVGQRIPDWDWHLIHLYDPRAVVPWSIMPPFPYLFELRDPATIDPGRDRVVPVTGPRAPQGRVVVAKPEAIALVQYLISLNRTYDLPPHLTGMGGEGGRGMHTMP